MKFNLKNFPRTVEGENRDEADIWVEGFEKELRERAEKSNFNIKDFIEEILAESE